MQNPSTEGKINTEKHVQVSLESGSNSCINYRIRNYGSITKMSFVKSITKAREWKSTRQLLIMSNYY